MKVVIIDDEPLARMLVKEYLQAYPQVQIMEECGDGFEGLKAIQKYQPDLVFLDIQMPKINGFEMLELVEDPPAVIFTTAFDEFAIKAFETHAIDYLLKPYSKERFDKAIQKYLLQNGTFTKVQTQSLLDTASQSHSEQRVVVKDGVKIKIIPLQQIQYLEAADDYVKIYTAEGVFLKKKTMRFFETGLPPQQFVRIHRSYIVAVSLINKIDHNEKDSYLLLLSTGTKLPVSKSGYIKLKEILGL
ncbi:MAG: LytTR family transcriptional regulator DNA-binding domain-containing protein [Ferruginibacter sp.]